MNIHGLSIPNFFTDKKLNNVTVNKTTRAISFVDMFCNLLEEKSLTASKLSGLHSLEGKDNDAVRIAHDHKHNYCSLCGSMIESDGSCPICIVPTIRCGNTAAENLAIRNQAISQAGSAPAKAGGQTTSRLGSSKK